MVMDYYYKSIAKARGVKCPDYIKQIQGRLGWDEEQKRLIIPCS